MSIVGTEIAGARVLDLFSGSGALGLEALSRGAVSAHFVDNHPESLALIKANAASLGAGDRAVIHRAEALAFIAGLAAGQFDVAFADPPYDQSLATRVADQWLKSRFAAVLGIEHRVDEKLPGDGERRKYGGTVITFFRTETGAADRAIITADSLPDSKS